MASSGVVGGLFPQHGQSVPQKNDQGIHRLTAWLFCFYDSKGNLI
jgi:hypothetical protein